MSQDSGWRPSASLETIQRRAELLAAIRAFLQQRGVMEVETPVCSAHGTTDPALASLTSRYTGPGAPQGRLLYLHTSPEFPMKRLLAAGCGAIYQICRVFRDGEAGRLHNPEFTLLEWYRPGFDHHRLMEEVVELVNGLLPEPRPVEKLTYGELFQRHLSVDPHCATVDDLRQCAEDNGVPGAGSLELTDRDGWLDLLLSHLIEPDLGDQRLTFVYDYPASQASLARLQDGDPPVAQRFELYLEGMELANGFCELTDPQEQRRRFDVDRALRRQEGWAEVPMDENLLAALEAGLPDCSGVALGIDRLLMLLTGASTISEVLAFPLERA